MRRRRSTSPEINWPNDDCSKVVPATCKEIGISLGVTLGSAVLMTAFVYWRKAAIGARMGSGDFRSLK